MQQKEFKKLLDRLEPEIRAAFQASIAEIISKVVLREVQAALKVGNIEEAIATLHIETAAFQAFQDARARAFLASGRRAVELLPKDPRGQSLVVRFDGRAPGAEQWLGVQSSEKIVDITEEAITVARNTLTTGLEQGRHPNSVALDLVGRVDPQTRKRVGGTIGLSPAQERALVAAREELSDPSTMSRFFARTLRAKGFDSDIHRAIEEGRNLTAEQIDNILGRYSNNLLLHRGKTIGRTEAMGALHGATREAYQQAIDSGSVKAEEIERYWDDTGDRKTRPSHSYLARTTKATPIGFNENYVTEDGSVLRYPGDPEAPASEIINCRCNEIYKINFLARAKAEIRRLRGGAD